MWSPVWPAGRWSFPPRMVALFLPSAYATLNRTFWLGFAVHCSAWGLCWSWPHAGGPSMAPVGRDRARCWDREAAILTSRPPERPPALCATSSRAAGLALWPETFEQVTERPLIGYGFGRGLLRNP